MPGYDDYCPIAVGVEVIGDRWTPLVLRELLVGCTRFNDIHRGVPRMSRTLLSKRLRDLERNGLVARERGEYRLTPAGADLEPIVWGIGEWAARWLFRDPTVEQLDATSLAWRMHQLVDTDEAPQARTCVELRLTGPGGGRRWLLFEHGAATVCQEDHGYEVDLLVHGDSAVVHRWFLGRLTWQEATDSGLVRVDGPADLARGFPRWFAPSPAALAVAAARVGS